MNAAPGLFDEFDAAERELTVEQEHHGQQIRAHAIERKTSRLVLRRAKSEAVLHEILPAALEMGTSYHVISHGDVDALSYLIHIARHIPIERVLISTWCMAMPDVEWVREQIRIGRIGGVDYILGEIFPSQYPDEYTAVAAMVAEGIATMKVARNHAKVMAGSNPDAGTWFAIESSSNVNTNPRIEQTAIHMDRDLHDFYLDFYAGIKSIDGARYHKPKKQPEAAHAPA